MEFKEAEMNAYIDASVVVRLLLGEPEPIPDWGKWGRAVSSEFVTVEVMRAVERLHVLREIPQPSTPIWLAPHLLLSRN